MSVRDIARKFSFCGFAAAATVALMVGGGIALSAALDAYSRAEHRYVAENQVARTHIVIGHAKQHARIPPARIEAITGHHLQYAAYIRSGDKGFPLVHPADGSAGMTRRKVPQLP